MITPEAIALAARKIIESSGAASLSMRTLASLLGVKAPSLYDHVRNRDEVLAMVQAQGLRHFGDGFANAGQTPREKILFYRSWALANPNIYPVVFQQKLHRELLPQGLEASVLGLVIEAAGGSHIKARAMWAQLHGLVDLELQSRLPADADMKATWEAVITMLEDAKN